MSGIRIPAIMMFRWLSVLSAWSLLVGGMLGGCRSIYTSGPNPIATIQQRKIIQDRFEKLSFIPATLKEGGKVGLVTRNVTDCAFDGFVALRSARQGSAPFGGGYFSLPHGQEWVDTDLTKDEMSRHMIANQADFEFTIATARLEEKYLTLKPPLKRVKSIRF